MNYELVARGWVWLQDCILSTQDLIPVFAFPGSKTDFWNQPLVVPDDGNNWMREPANNALKVIRIEIPASWIHMLTGRQVMCLYEHDPKDPEGRWATSGRTCLHLLGK